MTHEQDVQTVQAVRNRYDWLSLLKDIQALVPQAQAVSWWVHRRPGGDWHFQNALGFEHPEVWLPVRVAAFPGQETWFEGQPIRLEEADLADFPKAWKHAYIQAGPPQPRLPKTTVVLPWLEGRAVFFVDAWDAVDALPDETTLREVLGRYRDMAYNQAAWSEFHRALRMAVHAMTRLVAPERQLPLSGALDVLAAMLPYDRVMLWLRKEDTLVVEAARGFPEDANPLGLQLHIADSPLVQEILRTRRPRWMPEARFFWESGSDTAQPGSWLALPILEGGEDLLGLLVVERDAPYGFLGDEIRLASDFTVTISRLLQQWQAWQALRADQEVLRRRTRFLEALYRLSEILTGAREPETLWHTAASHIQASLEAQRVQGWAVQDNVLQLTCVSDEAARQTKPTLPLDRIQHLVAYLREGRAFHSTRAAEEDWLRPFMEALNRPLLPAVLALPIGAGELFQGVLLLERERRFTPEEIELALAMSRQLGTALHQAQLWQTTRQLTQELERRVEERTAALRREQQRAQLLARVLAELAGSLDLEQILNRTQEVLMEGLGARQAMIVIARPEENRLYWRSGRGEKRPPYGGQPLDIPLNDPLAQAVTRARVPLAIENTEQTDLDLEAWWRVLERRYGSLVAVPLTVGVESIGALLLFRDAPGPWDADDLDMLQTVGMQLALAIQNAEIFNILQEQSREQGRLLHRMQVESQRIRAILNAVADGILVTDSDMRVTLVNPSAERLLGIHAHQVLGRPLEEFRGLLGEQAGLWMEKIQRWSQEPEAYQGEVAEAQLEMENGRVLSVRMAPVFLQQREFLGTVSVIRDITHHIELDRMKSAFVANVSHELRTPLTAIKGYVEVLLQGMAGELSPQQKNFLNIIRNHTERLIMLVNDLLDLSRLEAGRIRLQQEKVDLQALLRELERDFRRRIEQEGRQLQLTVDVPEDLPPIFADAKRTTQIIANLMENAVRYTPDGGQIHVWSQVWDEDPDFVLVAVKDTGIGIPPEEQPKVFERFYRGHHPLVLAAPGTGLGLPIVKQLVEMQGGRIWLESTGVPGEGTTFYVTFPVYRGQQPMYVEKT